MRPVRFIAGVLLTIAGLAPLSAQTGTVRGHVTANDAAHNPVKGATVTIGTRGTITAGDGSYTITGVASGSDSVRARIIGYAPQTKGFTLSDGGVADVDFALDAQAVSLAEVVVVGYGTQKAGDITGAVTAVGDSQFNTGRVISPQMLIQSKVAGVQVIDNNDPGGGLSLRIRGATSVNASSEPLYVVDGVPLGTGAGGGLSAGRDPLNFINPSDIESITVLKDASSAAIYGTNAANGVVLITTKSGDGLQGTRVEYSSSASATSVTRLPNVLNAAQFAAVVTAHAPQYVDSLMGANTNWFGQVDRTGVGQEHNVSIAVGDGASNYRISLGYLNQNGIIKASQTERLSLGFDYRRRFFNDRLSIQSSLRGSKESDQFTPGDVLGNAAAMAPTSPVLDPNSWTGTGYWNWNTSNASPFNPAENLNFETDQGTTWRSIGNVQAQYRVPSIDGLAANVNVGYDITQANRQSFGPNNIASQTRQGHGYVSLANNNQSNDLLEAYLNYQPARLFGPGSIDVTGGYSFNQAHAEYPTLQENNLTSNLVGDNGIPPSSTPAIATKTVTDYRLISLFGRATYNINDRYIVDATLRHDGSSRFGPGRQWGTFPSAGVAWRISQEPFFKGLGSISDLKLRGSWAQTGNQAFGDYLQYPTYTYSDAASQVLFDSGFVTTIRPSAVDQNIHWEKTTAYDIGTDFAVQNGRFTGTIDWYTKNTSDLIFNVPACGGCTFSNFVTTNIGSMKNQGFEFSLEARLLEVGRGPLSWTASLTASHNTNTLESIASNLGVSSILTGGISGGVGSFAEVLEPGVPVNSFFVLQQKYQNGKPVYTPGATLYGDTSMYVDQNHDGIISDADRRPFHDPAPKWILGFSSYFTYGHFDASFTLRAYLGNYVYNNVASANGSFENVTGSAMPANMDASVLTTGFDHPQYYSSYYVQNASFLRADNITIGYSFAYSGVPLRLFGTIQNAFTITGYDGVDPTAGLMGIDNNIYPRGRTVTGGLSVQF